MVDEQCIAEFSRFLEGVNPSDFGTKGSKKNHEALTTTQDPADIAEAVRFIQSFLSGGEATENSRTRVMATASMLAYNDNLDEDAADTLVDLYKAGTTILGPALAMNESLGEINYLFLARMGDEEVRMKLAGNPAVGPDVIRVLLTDKNSRIVMEALDQRNCSAGMMYFAAPAIVKSYCQLQAMQVSNILTAQTEDDFELCAPHGYKARLMEAYANNRYTPEAIILELRTYSAVAGEMAKLNLSLKYYEFQK